METTILGGLITRKFVLVGDINLAKPRENGFQQFMLVFDHNEKTGRVTEEFDTPAESRLCVDCELVCVIHDNAFKEVELVALDVCLCKLLEFVADKFDALSVRTVYKHYIILDSRTVKVVDPVDKVADDGSLPAAGRTVENDVGDFADVDEIIEL
jgi:hypothetical protein